MSELPTGTPHSDLFDNRHRIQRFADAALENGLNLYERRHPKNTGLIQGSVVFCGTVGLRYPGRGSGRAAI